MSGNLSYGSSYPASCHRVTVAVQGQPSGISTAGPRNLPTRADPALHPSPGTGGLFVPSQIHWLSGPVSMRQCQAPAHAFICC